MKAVYPYLAIYNDTSQYEGVIVMMTASHQGTVMFIPTANISPGDPRLELAILDTLLPANSEIDKYDGSITYKNDADPVLTE